MKPYSLLFHVHNLRKKRENGLLYTSRKLTFHFILQLTSQSATTNHVSLVWPLIVSVYFSFQLFLCSYFRQRHHLFWTAPSSELVFFYIPTSTSAAAICLTEWQMRVLPLAHQPMWGVHKIFGSSDFQHCCFTWIIKGFIIPSWLLGPWSSSEEELWGVYGSPLLPAKEKNID